MANEEQEKSKTGTVIAIFVIFIAIVILIYLLKTTAPDQVPDQTTEPDTTANVEIEVVEPGEETGLANPSAVYCEEQGGKYLIEEELCEIKELKRKVLPNLIDSWEAQGFDCDEPEIDPATNQTSAGMINCYETVQYDAWEFWENSPGYDECLEEGTCTLEE